MWSCPPLYRVGRDGAGLLHSTPDTDRTRSDWLLQGQATVRMVDEAQLIGRCMEAGIDSHSIRHHVTAAVTAVGYRELHSLVCWLLCGYLCAGDM